MKIKYGAIQILVILLLIGCGFNPPVTSLDGLNIVHLKGSAYERGLIHGKSLKESIHIIINRWKLDVEKTYGMDFNVVIDDFLKQTDFVSFIELNAPELLQEIRGIAKGAGLDYETMLAFQLSEEIDVFSNDLPSHHCTSISINKRDTLHTLLAQNMDPPLFLHGFPTLLHIIDTKRNMESYILTVPGLIGMTGLNSKGVGITCNSISMLNHSKRGLPIAFIVRTVLTLNNEYEAFSFIENATIGIPQCFTIGGKTEARCYECSANEIKLFYPYENKNITLHTNFAASNRDFNNDFVDLLIEYGRTVDDPYYCPRYFLAYDKIIENDYLLDVSTVQSILSLSEPEIEPISNKYTYASLVMILSENPCLYIAPGKPHQTAYYQLTF